MTSPEDKVKKVKVPKGKWTTWKPTTSYVSKVEELLAEFDVGRSTITAINSLITDCIVEERNKLADKVEKLPNPYPKHKGKIVPHWEEIHHAWETCRWQIISELREAND